jgi:hypothetical protein
VIGDHADAQRVASQLGSLLGSRELRDSVCITTDTDSVRVQMYRANHPDAADVLVALCDFIHDNGVIDRQSSEFVIGRVIGVPVVGSVAPDVSLSGPTHWGIYA